MYKIRTRLLINLSSIARFSKLFCQGVPYKAENWYALSHEQYFSQHHFLNICRCAFSELMIFSGVVQGQLETLGTQMGYLFGWL